MERTVSRKAGSRILAYLLLVCLLVSLLPSSVLAASNGVPDVKVATAQDGYTGRFPDVTRTSDGLVAAFYWNAIDSHAPWAYGDPLGSIQIVYGSADAKTWTKPQMFVTPEKLAEWGLGIWRDSDNNLYYNAEDAAAHDAELSIEARDPNLITMKDGTVVFTFFTRLPDTAAFNGYTFQKTSTNYTYGRTYIMYSKDEGKTWSTPTEIACSFLDKGCAKRGDIAVYSDNSLLIPLYGYNSSVGGTFTTANVRAVLNSDGTWSFPTEYSSHDFEGTGTLPGAFRLADTEVSFGVTRNDVTYALCRSSGDFLVSYDKGASWTLLANNRAIRGRDTQQPSFFKLADSDSLFVTWSESVTGGRSIYGKVYDPDDEWDLIPGRLIYENSNGGDMADPTGIQLENGQLFTIFYDVGARCIGGVFNTVEELSQLPPSVDPNHPTYSIFSDDFERYTLGSEYTSNPDVFYHTWTRLSKIQSETDNQYLELTAPYNHTDGRKIDSTRFKIKPLFDGDGFIQFDYTFNWDVADTTFQAIYVRLANSDNSTTAEDDPVVIQIRQDVANGGNYLRVMNSSVPLTTVQDAFETGKTYTIKIWRVGSSLYIKNWLAGTEEPEEFVISKTLASLKSSGYIGFAYQCQDYDNISTLRIDNIQVQRNYALDLTPTSLNMVVNDAPVQLTATLSPASGEAIAWESDAPDVATVSDAGLVTAVGAGEATITAASGSLTATCKVYVAAPSDEFAADKTSWHFLDEDFDDVDAGNYTPEDFTFTMLQNDDPSDAMVIEDGDNQILQLTAGPNSAGRATRMMFDASGDYTVSFDFKMPYAATGSAWQSIYIMLGDNADASFQIRQWEEGGNNSGKIRFVDVSGNLLDLWYEDSADPVKQVFNDVFETGADAPWYSVKVVHAGGRMYVKLWQQGTAEPDGFQYMAKSNIFTNASRLQIAYQVSNAGSAQHLLLDNFLFSKKTEMSISDPTLSGSIGGSDTLSVVFDRDVAQEEPVPDVIWASDDDAVATVDQAGNVSYTGPGQTIIRATVENLVQTCLVSVTAQLPTPEAIFEATGPDCGVLRNVDSSMKYSLDSGATWQPITGETALCTGVTVANGIQVKAFGADAYNLDSEIQTITVTKHPTPASPTLVTSSDYTLTINAVIGQQYSIDGGQTWVTADGRTLTFSSLLPDTTYAIITRIPASGTALASDASAPLSAYTQEMSTVNAQIVAGGQTIVARTTLDPDTGAAKISLDDDALRILLADAQGDVLIDLKGLSSVACVDVPTKILQALAKQPEIDQLVIYTRTGEIFISRAAVVALADGQTADLVTLGVAANGNLYHTDRASTTYDPSGFVCFKASDGFYIVQISKIAKFTDCDLNAWYAPYVEQALAQGLFDGVSDTQFAPKKAMSRAMLVTVLWRAAGQPAVSGSSTFADVADPDAWYYDAVVWAASNGIVDGYSDTVFGPNDPLTRQQMVTILYRFDQLNGGKPAGDTDMSGYTDWADVSDWAQDAFQWAVGSGIVDGVSDTSLAPAGSAQRCEVATILVRYLASR